MQTVTYKKYKTLEEAFDTIQILEDNGISYETEDISPEFDVSFSGGTELVDKIALKLQPDDFETVSKLLQDAAEDSIKALPEDHYLFAFNNDELFEILEKYDEWNTTDYVLAAKLLKKRGTDLSAEEILEMRNKRNTFLRKPESGHTGWLIFGFLCALAGGLFGIFIGYHHFNFKKSLPTGERVYAYDTLTRKRGLTIFYIGLVSIIIWLGFWIFFSQEYY